MDGPLQLAGPLRPVPIYCQRPFDLELSPGNHLPASRLSTSPGSSDKAKDTIRPSHQQLQVPLLLTSRTDFLDKRAIVPPYTKTRELSPLDKHGVPLITPVRGPDPRSVALYQSLLRRHPAYHHLLETFLLPPLPPLLCHPAAALCDPPFGFCTPSATLHPPASPAEGEKGRVPPRPQPPQARESTRQRVGQEAASDSKGPVSGGVSAEDLVSSITPVPDPYQQYGYGRKLFPCSQCRYTTDRRNNLKRHMLTMHQLSTKLLECCGVLFRTKAALREHALIFHYHGYTCFYCGRRFCRKALLKRHLSVHNGQKEFICNVCDYATSHKSNLERHRRVHMRQDDDPSCLDDTPSDGHRDEAGHMSEDDISVCSHDEENEEINVHSD
ncbi:uncharacterized protein [Littorina saxatilis]|uniref:C2H2-type domain-containing protein n=1 Tax=Littorina saxatilis TaxID=31220 RepID=A0AAN9ANS3_9CAEN